MKHKNLIIGICIIAILLIIGIIIGVFIYESRYKYEIEEITKYKYNLIYIDEKYGVIDENGEIIIEPNYSIIQIPNPTKPVFICMKDYQIETKEYQVSLLNEKSEEIFTEFEKVETIQLKDEKLEIPYEKSVLKFKQNDKYGLIDYAGNIILEAVYDDIQSVSYKEGTLKVKQNDKYGVINIKGTELIPVEYNSIYFDGYYDEEFEYQKAGFIVSKTENEVEKFGYRNEKGKQILKDEYEEITRITETEEQDKAILVVWQNEKAGVFLDKTQRIGFEYDEIEYDKQSGLFIVTKDAKQGVLNCDGKEILPVQSDRIYISGEYISAQNGEEIVRYDSNGMKLENQNIVAKWKTENEEYQIIMDVEEMYGIQDKNGQTLVKNKYRSLEYLHGEYFIAINENRKMGVINKEGKSTIELKYDQISKIEDSNLIKAVKNEDEQIDLYTPDMNFIITLQGTELLVEEINGYFRIHTTGFVPEYYSKEGKKVSSKEVYANSEQIAKEKDGKWGYTDLDGNLKVEFQYEKATEFNQYGFAGIRQDGKWGVINLQGEVVQEPIYELEEETPEFLGKYYQVSSLGAQVYYTNYTGEESEESTETEEVIEE